LNPDLNQYADNVQISIALHYTLDEAETFAIPETPQVKFRDLNDNEKKEW